MPDVAELVEAFSLLIRAAEQKDHYKTQPREEGKFAPHGGGSGGAHKTKAKGKAKPEKPGIFEEEEDEGGYYKQLPDGGIEWVPEGREKPSEKRPGGTTIKTPDGRERAATVENHNGVRILTPDDLNSEAQRITTDEVKGFIDQIPAEHRDALVEIHLMDEPFRDENGKTNENATATYYVDTGIVEIHSNSRFSPEVAKKTISQTVRHETAHGLTDKLGASFIRDWERAARKDGNYISDYAQKDTHEDIAETIARYWSPDPTDRRVVERFFPERYAILKQYGVKPGG